MAYVVTMRACNLLFSLVPATILLRGVLSRQDILMQNGHRRYKPLSHAAPRHDARSDKEAKHDTSEDYEPYRWDYGYGSPLDESQSTPTPGVSTAEESYTSSISESPKLC